MKYLALNLYDIIPYNLYFMVRYMVENIPAFLIPYFYIIPLKYIYMSKFNLFNFGHILKK